MTLIADANVIVKSIAWSGEYGLGLNVDCMSNENGDKVHVILWSDSELFKDEHGYYMDIQSVFNGVLVIQNPDIKLNRQIIAEMLSLPMSDKNRHHKLLRLLTGELSATAVKIGNSFRCNQRKPKETPRNEKDARRRYTSSGIHKPRTHNTFHLRQAPAFHCTLPLSEHAH